MGRIRQSIPAVPAIRAVVRRHCHQLPFREHELLRGVVPGLTGRLVVLDHLGVEEHAGVSHVDVIRLDVLHTLPLSLSPAYGTPAARPV